MVSARAPVNSEARVQSRTALAPQPLIVSEPTMPATWTLMQPRLGPRVAVSDREEDDDQEGEEGDGEHPKAALSSRGLSL